MLRSLLVIGILLIATLPLASQQRWGMWYFGVNAGIDFASGSPVVVRGLTNTIEGTASIADPATRTLLFYTDGMSVWNRNHVVMPNGRLLLGHISSTQSALIVPHPGNADHYYVFTVDAHENMAPRRTYYGVNYSVVDMSLDGGNGDVTTKNIRIEPQRATEKLCGVKRCTDGTYWVIMREADTQRFHAYHIDSSGISAPVISFAGTINRTASVLSHRKTDLNGYLKSSIDGGKLALVQGGAPPEIFDFDQKTGSIRLAMSIPDTLLEFYGVAFSPDGTRLYAMQMRLPSLLVQYDLTAGTPRQVADSRVVLATYLANGGALQLGLDGRIYIAIAGATTLDVIASPNSAGMACDLITGAIGLRGAFSSLGLPNVIDSDLGFASFGGAGEDHALCGGDSVMLTAYGGARYRWKASPTLSCTDCASPIAKPTATTAYAVEIFNSAGCSRFDTVVVAVRSQPSVAASVSGEICIGETATLSSGGGVRWQWSPSTALSCTDCASPRANPRTTTLYSVTSWSEAGCIAADTVSVVVHARPITRATGALTVCAGTPVQLHASGAESYQWSPSDGLSCTDCADPIATRVTSGIYHVVGTSSGGCSSSDSVAVSIATNPTRATGALTVCAGTPVQLHASGAESYQWTPSDGLSCTDCADPIATRVTSGTYHVVGTSSGGCSSSDSVAVSIATTTEIVTSVPATKITGIGIPVIVPIVVTNRDAVARESSLELDVTYDASILKLTGFVIRGTMVDGGKVDRVSESAGRMGLRLVPGNVTNTDTLVSLIFRAYLGDHLTGDIAVALRPSSQCVIAQSSSGSIIIDSLCGLNLRLIELIKPSTLKARPNPFSDAATIEYSIASASHVVMRVFDATGVEVHRAVDGWQQPGTHTVVLDRSDVPAGALLVQLESDGAVVERRLVRR